MTNSYAEKISRFIPLISTLKNYSSDFAKRDIIAGLTVAIVAVPQTMAYAIIAGLPPVLGLYTAIVSAIIASIFGSSNFLIAGTTNAIALLIASNMKAFADREDFLQMVFLMTFIVGLLQIAFAVLKLGKVINYVSHSVVVGFTAGAGVLIAFGQFGPLLGASVPKELHSSQEKFLYVLEHLDKTNLWALGVGIVTIIIIEILKKINKNIPGSLIALIIAGFGVIAANLDKLGVKLTGAIPTNLPSFSMLRFDMGMASEVFGTAVIIAVIGLVEAISIAKAMAARTNQKLDTNQEFLAQGLSNSISSFFQCYAGTGSFCRSGVNFVSGAATRVSGILSGVFVAVILLFFGKYAMYIPTPALAGVIMVIAYNMIDKKEIKKIIKFGKSDVIALAVTFLATVILPEVSWAVFTGVIASILLYLKDSEKVQVRLLSTSVDNSQRITEHEINHLDSIQDIVTIQIEGNLYFGSAFDLETKLNIVENKAKVYVIRLKHVTKMDITAMDTIKNFIRNVKESGSITVICGVGEEIDKTLVTSGIVSLVGEENYFLAEKTLFASYERALAKSNEIVKTGAGIVPQREPAIETCCAV